MESKIKYYITFFVGLSIILTVFLTGCEIIPPPSAPAVKILSASPSSGVREQQLTITISGVNLSEVSKVSFGKGITVDSFSVDRTDRITASISISGDAEVGSRDIFVITPGEVAMLYGGFSVKETPPVLEISTKAIDLVIQEGENILPSARVSIRNPGGGVLNWSAQSERTWLEITPASGSAANQSQEIAVTLKLTPGMLAYAPYTTVIHISAPGADNSPQDVDVTLRVTGNARYIYAENGTINGADGKPIELIDNPKAINPTYTQLMKFIAAETTDRLPFVKTGEPFGYADFAEKVHNNAELGGIRASVVRIVFEKLLPIYTINVFETTDKGLVYIDCTGESDYSQLDELVTSNPTMSRDKVAYVVPGKTYGTIPVETAKSPDYGFYEEYAKKWQDYKDSLKTYTQELEQLEKDTYRHSLMTTPELNDYEARFYKLKDAEKALAAQREEFGSAEFKPVDVVKSITVYWSGGEQK